MKQQGLDGVAARFGITAFEGLAFLGLDTERIDRSRAFFSRAAPHRDQSCILSHSPPIGGGFVWNGNPPGHAIPEDSWNKDAQCFDLGQAPLRGGIPPLLPGLHILAAPTTPTTWVPTRDEMECAAMNAEKKITSASVTRILSDCRAPGSFFTENMPDDKRADVNAEDGPDVVPLHQIHAQSQSGQNPFGPDLPDGFRAKSRQGQENHAGSHVPRADSPAGNGEKMHVKPCCRPAQKQTTGLNSS